jgi:hypothetical protein
VALSIRGNSFLRAGSSENKLEYQIVDSFGSPLSNIKDVSKVSFNTLSDQQKVFSVVDSARLSGNVLSVDFGATVNTMSWDSYTLRVEFQDKQG